MSLKKMLGLFLCCSALSSMAAQADEVAIGLNYPASGSYAIQGLAQERAAEMAVDEINQNGGILGKKIKLIKKDTKSKPSISTLNVAHLIDNDGVKMVFGGSSSAVAISGGKAAKSRDRLYFGTLTYSNATTGKDGHTHMFRETYNAWMGAKVLSKYLKKNFAGKEFFYITADYTWGWSTENSIRKFSKTKDKNAHERVLVPFPGAKEEDFKKAMEAARMTSPEVLVLVLFGDDMAKALKMVSELGLKDKMAVVVPNLTLGMAQSAGPEAMEGVVGALPWAWNVPYEFGFETGQKFVEAFVSRYQAYPSSSAASAYAIVHQYKDAVERAGSFETTDVRKALEGHEYSLLKDAQAWRAFDHQNIQTVYAVKGKSKETILKDKFQSDYFEIIASLRGDKAARSKREWKSDRLKAGKSSILN